MSTQPTTKGACHADAGTTLPPHPVDTLMQEHEVILAVLEAMETKAKGLAAGTAVDAPFWRDAIEFLRNFADACHHGKEEGCLFPAMVQRGVPDTGGPVGVMKLEHVEGRGFIADMAKAVDQSNAAALRRAAYDYITLLRAHIDKENHILFVIARNVLQGPDAGAVLASYAEVERKVGDGEHCRWLGVAESLCAASGVDMARSRSTGAWLGGGCCGHHEH